MTDIITQSVASIIAALLQGQSSRISDNDLRILSRVASGSREATLALGGIAAVLAANDVIRRVPGSEVGPAIPEVGPVFPEVGPVFPEFDEGPEPIMPPPYPPGSPQPISPGPYPPDFPQPISPGPPDNPSGPQPISDVDITQPWYEQMVRYVGLDEFLVPAELESVSQFALENEKNFQTSQVVVPGETTGSVDFESRRSRVMTELGNLGDMLEERIRRVLPLIGQRLNLDVRNVTQIDVQMTASNDEEFFVAHADSGPTFQTRAISYVYFFNKEPAAFTGGELTLFDDKAVAEAGQSPSRFTTIAPAQNQIVFFPSSLLHEVRPVSVPSMAFEDSRFTVNGWVHV